MSFEDNILRKIDRERPQRQRESVRMPTFERAHKRAQGILQDPQYSIQAPSFIDLYGEANVMADMRQVMAKRKRFVESDSSEQKESNKVAEVFEAIVLEQSTAGGWLGANATALKTSLYDDYFNGTDMLAEWDVPEQETHVLGLSVDVTFSPKALEGKIDHIRKNVEEGNLGTVKYFRNKDGSFRGERRGIPRVVIGVDANNVFKLADLWIKGEGEMLKEHSAQRILVDEIAYQMEMIEKFAAKCGQRKVADTYGRSLSVIRKLQKQKEHLAPGEFAQDRVYKGIIEKTRRTFGTSEK